MPQILDRRRAKHKQNLQGLTLNFDSDALLTQFARSRIDFEGSKAGNPAIDTGGTAVHGDADEFYHARPPVGPCD